MGVLFRELVRNPEVPWESLVEDVPQPALVVERIDPDDAHAGSEEGTEALQRPFTMVPDEQESSAGSDAARFSPLTLGQDAEVEWVVKSDRNPFAGFVTLGRARNNDITIKSSSVSKIHLYLTHENGRWYAEDRGSTNGTFLRGTRLDSGKRFPLMSGDDLQFGKKIRAWFFDGPEFWKIARNGG